MDGGGRNLKYKSTFLPPESLYCSVKNQSNYIGAIFYGRISADKNISTGKLIDVQKMCNFNLMMYLLAVLSDLEPCVFLGPFLELVRSEETSGRITGLALTSLNKFISYDFIGESLCKGRNVAQVYFLILSK